MKSGSSGFPRRGQSLIILLGFLISGVMAAAQQPAAATPVGGKEGSAPAGQSAAQPIPEAAVSASGIKADPAKAEDGAKDIPDTTGVVKLGTGDLVEVSVYNVPELSSKVRVSNAGDIYLPLVDYVHVEGLTVEEAQALVEKRLSDGGFVRNPHVTIFVDDASSQGITVIGEVAKPGIYPITADHKLYEIISEAGGFSSSASRKIAILRRDQTDPIRVNLPRNLADDLSGNVNVMPGDTITVPRAPIIYVVGDVGRPSGFLVDNGQLTVLQALALAGGTNHTAKLGSARIIRKGPNGMTETRVEIKKLLRAKAPDIPLQGDDILFIPVSGGRVLASATFQAAMSAAAAVSIYTVPH